MLIDSSLRKNNMWANFLHTIAIHLVIPAVRFQTPLTLDYHTTNYINRFHGFIHAML
jgi:hypothetical protein